MPATQPRPIHPSIHPSTDGELERRGIRHSSFVNEGGGGDGTAHGVSGAQLAAEAQAGAGGSQAQATGGGADRPTSNQERTGRAEAALRNAEEGSRRDPRRPAAG